MTRRHGKPQKPRWRRFLLGPEPEVKVEAETASLGEPTALTRVDETGHVTGQWMYLPILHPERGA
jgi:hypothetical protein